MDGDIMDMQGTPIDNAGMITTGSLLSGDTNTHTITITGDIDLTGDVQVIHNGIFLGTFSSLFDNNISFNNLENFKIEINNQMKTVHEELNQAKSEIEILKKWNEV